MFPFWELAIAPVLEAAGATRVVEIGALAGETTELMLTGSAPSAELHVIDPRARLRPGRARAPLPGSLHLPPGPQPQRAADARRRWTPPSSTATTTGTPSTTSCSMLAEVVRARPGAPLPVLILHDVLLALRPPRPLLRRRSRSPRSTASPTPSGACIPGRRSCSSGGGLNPSLYNADRRGRARNGVMTGLEDFIAEHDRAAAPRGAAHLLRAGDRRRGGAARATSPSWPGRLDELEGAEGRTSCSSCPRRSGSRACVFQHNVFRTHERQLAEGADALPRPAQGRAARRALPRERGCASPTLLHCHRARRGPSIPASLRRPVQRNLEDRQRR